MSAPKASPAGKKPQSMVELISGEVMRKLRLAGEADTAEDQEIVCEEIFLDVSGILDDAAQAQLGAPQGCPFYLVLAHFYASPLGADQAVAVMKLLQNVYGQGYAAPLVALLLHRWLLLQRSPGRGLAEEQRVRLANVMAMGAVQLFVGDIQSGATLFQPMWHTLCYEVVLGEPTSRPTFWGLDQPNDTHKQEQRQAGMQRRSARLHSHDLGLLMQDQQDQQHTGACDPSASGSASQGSGTQGGGTQGGGNTHGASTHPEKTGQGEWQQEGQGGGGGDQQDQKSAQPRDQQDQVAQHAVLGQAAPGLVALPPAARNALIAAAAAPLPYYAGDAAQVEDTLQRLPPPNVPLHPAPDPSLPPSLRLPPAFAPGAGADFAVTEIIDTLPRIRSEAGLLRYLNSLHKLKGGPILMLVGPTTRLRLQSELYALTSPGGPHYPPRSVQVAALRVLDHLFTANQTTRNVMRVIFRLLHPTDWLGGSLFVPLQWASWAWGKVLLLLMSFFWWLYSLIIFRSWRRPPSQPASKSLSTSKGYTYLQQPYSQHYSPSKQRQQQTQQQTQQQQQHVQHSSPFKQQQQQQQQHALMPRVRRQSGAHTGEQGHSHASTSGSTSGVGGIDGREGSVQRRSNRREGGGGVGSGEQVGVSGGTGGSEGREGREGSVRRRSYRREGSGGVVGGGEQVGVCGGTGGSEGREGREGSVRRRSYRREGSSGVGGGAGGASLSVSGGGSGVASRLREAHHAVVGGSHVSSHSCEGREGGARPVSDGGRHTHSVVVGHRGERHSSRDRQGSSREQQQQQQQQQHQQEQQQQQQLQQPQEGSQLHLHDPRDTQGSHQGRTQQQEPHHQQQPQHQQHHQQQHESPHARARNEQALSARRSGGSPHHSHVESGGREGSWLPEGPRALTREVGSSFRRTSKSVGDFVGQLLRHD